MYDKYLVTGATGFLGRAVVEALARRGARVHALVLHDDPYINLLPKEVHTVIGDVYAENSLTDFFADADGRTCVIHCAGIVSVASRPGAKLYQVNVGGTWRVLRQCMKRNVGRLIHVSSVHAIPEKPKGCIITEDCEFSPGLVDGDYAKSKAAATELVFDAAERGLNASLVFPSGIIGPGDIQGGKMCIRDSGRCIVCPRPRGAKAVYPAWVLLLFLRMVSSIWRSTSTVSYTHLFSEPAAFPAEAPACLPL